jgi:alpha-glucosidase
MLGDVLLIAPPTTWESNAPWIVHLPGTGWYDYWTGAQVAGVVTTETPTLERLPAFVRPGSIIPRQPLVQSTGETPKGPLELAIYPGTDCRGSLYFDDGVSFAYQRGVYLRQAVTCDANAIRFAAREGKWKPWWSGIDVLVHEWIGPAPKVMLGGKPVPASVDTQTRTLVITLPDLPGAATVTIQR